MGPRVKVRRAYGRGWERYERYYRPTGRFGTHMNSSMRRLQLELRDVKLRPSRARPTPMEGDSLVDVFLSNPQESILSALRELAASLTPSLLSAVSESQIALWKTRDVAASKVESKEKIKGKEKKSRDKEAGSESSAADAEATEEKVRAKRREEWGAAMLLLEEAEPSNVEMEVPTRGHVQEPTGVSTWSNIAEPEKLSLYELEITTTETTMGAVKDGRAKLGVRYLHGQWIGNQRLFGADTSPSESSSYVSG